MSRLIRDAVPENLPVEDLIIEVALLRPGPIQGNMMHPYLRRRQGLDIEVPAGHLTSPRGHVIFCRQWSIPLYQYHTDEWYLKRRR